MKPTNHGMRAKGWATENPMSDFIPYSVQLDENTVKTHGGDYLQVIKMDGVGHESADPEDVIIWKDQLNTLLRNIANPNVALWVNTIRREEKAYPNGMFQEGFSLDLNDKYKNHLEKNKLMINEIYLTILFRPSHTKINNFFKKIEKNPIYLAQQQKDALEKIHELVSLVSSSLNRYGPKVLGIYHRKEIPHSEVLEFLAFLVNGEWQPRAISKNILSDTLASSRPFFGSDAFEVRGVVDHKIGAILGIGEYPEGTEAGLLNALLSAPFPLLLTQSFNFLSKPVAIEILKRQQRRMRNAGDLAVSQINSIDDALDDLVSSRIVYGEHHLSLTVYGNDARDLKENLSAARAELADCSMVVSREDWAIEAAYWAQLPGNFKHRPRPAPISSKNFAGFSSFHNYPIGRRIGNQWGPAVSIFKTTSGSPYYFNFHEPLDNAKAKQKIELENSHQAQPVIELKEEQKALGNTTIIGPSSSGKTVVQGFLMAQSRKFNATQIIFDKDRGLEIFVRAMNGIYLPLKNAKPTGFNPFQLEPTEENTFFLEQLLKKTIGGQFNSKEELEIHNAVVGVMALPKTMRRFRSCLDFLDPVQSEGPYSRLQKWCDNGSLSWVFDNPIDELNFNNASMFGFDVTEFLDNAEVRTPIVMYLFHRIEQLMDGRRIMIFMDEFWKLLLDSHFEDLSQNKLKVIRKQNGIMVFGTQSPKDVLKSPIAHSIIEQCATMIFMPNPKGSHADYVDGFKLTEREFFLVKEEMQPGSRRFLIKQGHNSVVAELNLKGFEDELAVISGTTENVQIVTNLLNTHGHDSNKWLPEFHKQRRLSVT
ncbi:MAG: VirB4 family type IV secretion/conjugal transfer ATPase [Pseudomonadota bacterium]